MIDNLLTEFGKSVFILYFFDEWSVWSLTIIEGTREN